MSGDEFLKVQKCQSNPREQEEDTHLQVIRNGSFDIDEDSSFMSTNLVHKNRTFTLDKSDRSALINRQLYILQNCSNKVTLHKRLHHPFAHDDRPEI